MAAALRELVRWAAEAPRLVFITAQEVREQHHNSGGERTTP